MKLKTTNYDVMMYKIKILATDGLHKT